MSDRFYIVLKDPDGVYDSIREHVMSSLPDGLSEEERRLLVETRSKELEDELSTWIEFGEYVTLEVELGEEISVKIKPCN